MGVPAILALAGTAISAAGAAKEGQAQQQAAKANARLAKIDADNEAEQVARSADIASSMNRTLTAASGVKMEGSPLDVLVNNAVIAHRQISSIRRSYDAYANIMHKQGQSAVEASRWAIAGSVLRGAGSALGGSGFSFAFGQPSGGGMPYGGGIAGR